MPRYFFHTQIGDETVADPSGEVLPDADRAFEAARTMVLQLLQGAGGDPALLRACLVVADEAGETVLELPFVEALTAETPESGLH